MEEVPLEQTQNPRPGRCLGSSNAFGLDPEAQTPGRAVVRHIGQSLVKAMEMALGAGSPEAAEMVACECVVHAETKDHLNREMMGSCRQGAQGR